MTYDATRVDKNVLRPLTEAHGAVCHAFGRRVDRATSYCFRDKIGSDGNLVDESSAKDLTDHFELLPVRERCESFVGTSGGKLCSPVYRSASSSSRRP
jgi:hypothetical protein